MSTTAANLIRQLGFFVPLNSGEDDRYRKFCASIKRQVSPTMRIAMDEYIDRTEAHRNGAKQKAEYPRHTHVRKFPNRASMGRRITRANC
jgi:hypothetical protein